MVFKNRRRVDKCPLNGYIKFKMGKSMEIRNHYISLAASALALALTTPAYTAGYNGVIRSNVAFNNGSAEQTENQPEGGMQVAYQIQLEGGDLDGCTLDIVESLFGRDEGAWGIFDIEGQVSCSNGDFSYTSSGAWDGNGFHASGDITGGSGDYEDASGRVAQLGGFAKPADDGTLDIGYELVVDMSTS